MIGLDGVGLPEVALEIVRDDPTQIVHLRLRDDGHYPITGCGGGLGQWWTGKTTEVTCADCLELVHA